MPSIKRQLSPSANPRPAAWLLSLALGLAGFSSAALTQTPPALTHSASQELLLSVVVNGHDTGKLATFTRLADGRLMAKADDLATVGVKPSAKIAADGMVSLDSLSGVTWRYDEPKQAIFFNAGDEALVPNIVDVGGVPPPIDYSQVRSDYGLLMNYTLYGASQSPWSDWSLKGATSTFSGSFEGRVLTPFGTASSTALARSNQLWGLGGGGDSLVRLDTSWRYVDPESLTVYQAGDSVSGSLAWTSAYRFGGFQIGRNFRLRPDMIAAPLPTFAGSASLPSTLDLYMNNIRVFSGEVPAGPFNITGLPILGGSGDARIVMRDALGREVVTQSAYFYVPDMLRQGLFDYSAEIGFPRLNYGVSSFAYDPNLAGSASARYGLTDWMTVEGHAEATKGLVNGGAGAITSLGWFGAIRFGAAASYYNALGASETGGKVSALYQISRKGYSLNLGIDRMLGDYNDVALAVDRRYGNLSPLSARAREVLRAGVSFPMPFDTSSMSLNVTRIRGVDPGLDSTIFSASWSRTVLNNIAVYITGYTGKTGKRKSSGVFAGLTIPLGDNIIASSGVSHSAGVTSINSSVSKTARLAEGQLGWSVYDRSIINGTGSRGAAATYRSSVGTFTGSVEQAGSDRRLTGTVEGSVVVAGGDIFVGNRIDDAFAVIKAGGPNVPVLLNSTTVATTNRNGRALVPYLQSYRTNRVSIDPKNLPFDLQPDETEASVVPADRAGVVVDFGVRKVDGALIVLNGPDGQPVPVGSEILLQGAEQPVVAGYDGRAYLTGLAPQNTVTVTLPANAGTCRASFDFQPLPGAQPEIGPISCR